MRKPTILLAIAIPACCLLAVIVYNLPPVYERLAWRVEALRADIKYVLEPPEDQVFIPRDLGTTAANQTVSIGGSVTPTEWPSPTSTISLVTPKPVATSTPVATPSSVPTPVPSQAMLTGIVHEYQMWNNCGPANLAMALSFWGWKGDQRETAAFLKPNARDKNVMPYEMEAFVDQKTDLKAVVRVGGDLLTIKAFVSAGFPVLVEKGFEGVGFDGWMGHYEVINGYNDAKEVFYVQDSYKGPNLAIRYEDLQSQWRAFNYTYLATYPLELRQQVLDILGLQAYDNFNYHTAEQKAVSEAATLTGRDLYFALFNHGTSLVDLKDYTGAAAAYDAAFANYALIPQEERPWRMLWYQTGPYFAYYYTGRYQDVINLATQTLDAMSEPILEESFYWRGMARLAMGDQEGAIEDFKKSVEVHPEFQPGLDQLGLLGIEP
jgi:hypothetical protein